MTELVFTHLLSTTSYWHSSDFSLNILAYITTHHTMMKTNISENMQVYWLRIQIYFPQDYRGCCLRLEWNVEPQEDGFGPLDQTLNQKDLCAQQTYHSWWATSTFAFTLLPHSITHTHMHTDFAKQRLFKSCSFVFVSILWLRSTVQLRRVFSCSEGLETFSCRIAYREGILEM